MVLRSLFAAAAVLTLAAGSAEAQPAAPAAAPATAPAGGFTEVAPKGDIVQTLQASGQFRTLLKTLDMTNLTGLLKRPQPITIFAPTDAAFAAMPAGELTRLMQPANGAELQGRILYLIFNAGLDYGQIKGTTGPVPSAAPGKSIYIAGTATPPKVNDASLLQADVKATNGDIYVIDGFISPAFVPPPPPPEPVAEPEAPAAPAAKAPAKRKAK